MSGLIHSIRSLFGTPPPSSVGQPRDRSRASSEGAREGGRKRRRRSGSGDEGEERSVDAAGDLDAGAAANEDDGAAEEEGGSEVGDPNPSPPLTDFFSHLNDDRGRCRDLARRAFPREGARGVPETAASAEETREGRMSSLVDYFTRRLQEEEDEEESAPRGVESGDIAGRDTRDGDVEVEDDQLSISSEVLNEPFGAIESAEERSGRAALNAADSYEEDENDDDVGVLLETQPQTAKIGSGSPSREVDSPPVRGERMIREDKRGRGRIESLQGSQSWPRPADRRTRGRKRRRTRDRRSGAPAERRGLMWDGRLESVPSVYDAESMMYPACTRIDELDLRSTSLDLSLCRVLHVWDVRLTKRAVGAGVGGSASMAPGRREDDGPLYGIYKRALSLEVAQVLEGGGGGTPPASPSVTDITVAAFRDGKSRLERAASWRRRHSAQRLKVFLYDGYANAASLALEEIRSRSSTKRGGNVEFLLSLTGVPAECILPRSEAPPGCDPRLVHYVDEPFGDEELGVLSPYCACVGGASMMRRHDGRLRFDSGDLEMRLAEALASGDVREEVVISAATVRGDGDRYIMEVSGGILARRHGLIVRARSSSMPLAGSIRCGEEDGAAPLADAGAEVRSGYAAAGLGQDEGCLGNLRPAATDAPSGHGRSGEDSGTAASRANSAATAIGGVEIDRPSSIIPLRDLLPMLVRHNMPKRLRGTINVYGVVLGFSPPSLTKTQEWMMSIALVDETLPLPSQDMHVCDSNATIGCDSRPKDKLNRDPKSMHVPSVTLVLFSKDKLSLPFVRSAGDVVCCQKVVLQSFNGEPQILARRNSDIAVARPERPCHLFDGEPGGLSSPDGWNLSCSRRGVEDEARHAVCWELGEGLWRWGQRRLSAHPTVSPNCRLSIARAGDVCGDDHGRNGRRGGFEAPVVGDMTAAVTAIVPVPEQRRRSDTPRGYLRLWDGTGPSASDPVPSLGDTTAGGISNQFYVDDPPEEVLVRIEEILRDTTQLGGRKCQPPIALCGRVMNAIIWEENLWNLICDENIIAVGSFVRLRNVNATWHAGATYISVHVRSSLTPLPFDAYEVKILLRAHDSSVKRGVPSNPTSAILPVRSGRGSGILPEVMPKAAVQREKMNTGLSTIDVLLRTLPPQSFTVQFEVSRTIPECNPESADATEALKALVARRRDGTLGFRFAFHVKDASSEMGVLCQGAVAERVLSATAHHVIKRKREKCKIAFAVLKEIMSPGSICEGKVRSSLGQDGKLYFILKSMFCITTKETF